MRVTLDISEMVSAPEERWLDTLNLPGTEDGEDHWPMFQGNAQHTGYYNP